MIIWRKWGPAIHSWRQTTPFEHFKDESWMPRYMERGTWENWEANGSRDIRKVCAEKVKDMLEELRDHEILPKDVRDAIDAVAAGSSEKAKNIKR